MTAMNSSKAIIVRYWSAISETSRISNALCACAVAKYCCSACVAQALHAAEEVDLPRGLTGRRSSRAARSPVPVVERLAGVRVADESANAPTCGNSVERWIRYCACVCATFSAATRKSRLFASANSTRRCSRGSVRKSRQPISTAGNVARSAGRRLVGVANGIRRGNRRSGPLVHRLQRATGDQHGDDGERDAFHSAAPAPLGSSAGRTRAMPALAPPSA